MYLKYQLYVLNKIWEQIKTIAHENNDSEREREISESNTKKFNISKFYI